MLSWPQRVDLKLWIIYLIMGVMLLLGVMFFIKTDRELTDIKHTLGMIELTVPSEGRDYTVPSADTKMIYVPPGKFMMGSASDEVGRRNDEIQHEVTLTKGYWLGKYEVTQGQYQKVMGTNPVMKIQIVTKDQSGTTITNDYGIGDDYPVYGVSWDEAKEYCRILTAIERVAGRLPKGYEYTLPTEAQWEYACRAGTTTALNSGKDLTTTSSCSNLDEVGWYGGNSGGTHPVGQKVPNDWDLYDMHGNVWEWCLDWRGDYPSSSVTDPTGASAGSHRLVRGGSWSNYAYYCRSAIRYGHYPDYCDDDCGFRVALSAVQ